MAFGGGFGGFGSAAKPAFGAAAPAPAFGGGFGAAAQGNANANNDVEVQQPPADGISSIDFTPVQNANLFAVTSWDKTVRCYDVQMGSKWDQKSNQNVQAPTAGVFKAQIAHDAPVLDCAFSTTGQHVFSGGCDKMVKMWTLGQPQGVNIGQHQAPVKCVHWVPNHNMVVTAGWDRLVKYWDPRTPGQPVKDFARSTFHAYLSLRE